MEIRTGLELVDVTFESQNKAVLTFLDAERGEVRVINFNKEVYDPDKKKWVTSEEKAEKVEGWCQDSFGLAFADLEKAVGTTHDVYCYDKFNSLFEVETVDKFTEDMVGQILQTTIEEITVDSLFIKIKYKWDGKLYQSKQTLGQYVESMKKFFPDPIKKEKEYQKFQKKFGVPVEEAQSLIGHEIMVEVKKAFGTNFWGDIKPFPKKK